MLALLILESAASQVLTRPFTWTRSCCSLWGVPMAPLDLLLLGIPGVDPGKSGHFEIAPERTRHIAQQAFRGKSLVPPRRVAEIYARDCAKVR